MDFYRKVRPFGFWTPVKRMLEEKGENVDRFERDRWDIPVALIGTLTFVLLYLLMMDLVLHNWPRAIWLGGGTLAGGALLYLLWWRHLLLEDDQESQ